MQDTRESTPDSQTVDSSCKTPDPLFLGEECLSQSSPILLPASGPPSISISHGSGLNITLSTPTAKSLPPDNASKSLISLPCLSSSAGCGLSSLSLPLSSSDPSSSSVSSSSASKPPHPLPLSSPALPWSLQTGVDCTTGGVLACEFSSNLKKNLPFCSYRAKAQEFIQATSQVCSQHQVPVSSASTSQVSPPPTLPPAPGLSPAQFILHSSLPLVGSTKTPPSLLHTSIGGGCYLKKLHTQERAVEEVKLAIKPYYQRKDINKDEYKDILRKAVHKICHSRTGEINPVKVSNLVKLYVQRYKYFRKHGRKIGEEEKEDRELGALQSSA
uniref:SFR19-like C-terminal domain-containing protein n=1 Tax=Takifugu rubripes TaxID=31033 RepID=A0A674NP70_TAKRU